MPRKLPGHEYDRPIEHRSVRPDDQRGGFETGPRRQRIELVAGELRETSPIGPQHENAVVVLTKWSVKTAPEDRVSVRVQLSIEIPEQDCVPEPDIARVKERRDTRRRPDAAEVLLLIEVADSSLEYDRGEKANLYAAAGIRDYWIVNVAGECVEVYHQPEGGRYRQRETLSAADEARPLDFPMLALPIRLLFPPGGPAR
jgi:Uma2 family endonuclease